MKIVHISTAATGGAGIAAFRLHSGLLKQPEIESYFAQMYATSPEQQKLNVFTIPRQNSIIAKIKRRLKISPEQLNRKSVAGKPVNYEIVSFPTTSYMIEDHPIIKDADIINLHWVADFLNYPTFFRKVKKPIVWTLHDMNPFSGIFHYKGDKISNYERFHLIDENVMKQKLQIIQKCKNINIVSPSNWLKEISEKSEIFGRFPHCYIPYGLDLAKYPILDRREVKEKLGVNNSLKTVAFIAHGVDIHRKGFDILKNAIVKLNDFNFNLISVGGNKIPVNDKINHIHFERIHDYREMNEVYSAADIVILPSREDNLPNVMLESFANGTPVISFSNGGMAEHIKTGENGILLNEISLESLTVGLKDFLDNKYNFDEQEIRNYAEKNFSESLQVERYINLYKQILS